MMYGRGISALAGCVGYGRFGMPMMGFGLVLLILAIVAIVYFIRKSNHKDSNTMEMELLNTRFVRGELTEEEYSRMKSVLKGK